MKQFLFVLFLCLSLALTGCTSRQPTSVSAPVQPSEAPAQAAAQPTAEQTQVPPTDTIVLPTDTPAPELKPASTLAPLPPEPQRVEFEASDGAKLVGMYYPAAVNPALVVVLMHWAGGDKNDWIFLGMAAWLQNRGLEVPATTQRMAFDTSYPFPPLSEELSFGVFIFDFRGFGESEQVSGGMSALASLWLLDAQAAYSVARTLEGADPERVVGMGASIGADAVVDACGEGCLGALSYGPGNYLTMAYSEAVAALELQGKTAWCVGANDDPPAVMACNSAEGEHYLMQIYAKGGHALELFRSDLDLDPPIEKITLDFLKTVFGIE